ncbi:MAG: WXG100 family type VII secretion target [Akkermansia sp.]
MPNIQLTAEDLERLASQLRTWTSDITNLNNQIKNTITQMDGWRDPQHVMFLNAVTMSHAQLKQYADGMEQLARALKTYAQLQEDTVKSFRSDMNRFS